MVNRFSRTQILALVGSSLLVLGVFMPAVNVPIIGWINLFNNGNGDGVLILFLAVCGVVLAFSAWPIGASLSGIGASIIIAYNFYHFSRGLDMLRGELEDNIFWPALSVGVQMSYSWPILALGAVLLIASSLVEGTINAGAELVNQEQTSGQPTETQEEGRKKFALIALWIALILGASGFVTTLIYAFVTL